MLHSWGRSPVFGGDGGATELSGPGEMGVRVGVAKAGVLL